MSMFRWHPSGPNPGTESSMPDDLLSSPKHCVTIWHVLLNLVQFKLGAFSKANVSLDLSLLPVQCHMLLQLITPLRAFPALAPPKCLDGKRQSDLKALQVDPWRHSYRLVFFLVLYVLCTVILLSPPPPPIINLPAGSWSFFVTQG